MTNFLVKHFVRNYQNTEDLEVRTAYGVLAGVVGIICNLFLFAVKFISGSLLHSVAVTADAFNNFSDAGSSIISLVGVKMAEKPADRDHPFGHGRIEYIAALIVAFLVLDVGFGFFKDSFEKILHPEELTFHAASVVILILSIGVKFWMSCFNRSLGKKIDSKIMMATAADAMGDMITTSVTILSILIFHFFHLNVDGLIGVIVAAIVMWAGVGIARDTLSPLIGAPADPETCEAIVKMVENYDGIMGTHDLIVHNYGPGRSIASIHAEVPQDADIRASHEIIDKAEREVSQKLNILLVIHMDPIETHDERVLAVRSQVDEAVHGVDPELSFHDFRMIDGKNQINLIFDLLIPDKIKDRNEIKNQVVEALKKKDPRYNCIITMDTDFVSH